MAEAVRKGYAYWMPLVLLVLLWYMPRQTAPGGLLEKFIFLRWMSVVILPLVFLLQFINTAASGRAFRLTAVAFPLCAFAAWSAVSALANGVGAADMAGNLILYIRYPLLFIALVNMGVSEGVMKGFTRLFFFLLAIQIPECLYRYLAMGIRWDTISWSLGPWGTFDLGVYMCYASALIAAYLAVKEFRWPPALLLILFFAVAMIGEIKAFIFAAPVAVAASALSVPGGGDRPGKALMKLAVPVLVLAAVYVVANNWGHIYRGGENVLTYYGSKVLSMFGVTSNYVADYQFRGESRISGFAYAWTALKGDWYRMALGFGPGSSFLGSVFNKGAMYTLAKVPATNQLAAILTDVGLVGLAVYSILLLQLLSFILKAKRRASDTAAQIAASGLLGMWIFFAVIGPFYDLVWRHDSPGYIFYFYLSYAYGALYRKSPVAGIA